MGVRFCFLPQPEHPLPIAAGVGKAWAWPHVSEDREPPLMRKSGQPSAPGALTHIALLSAPVITPDLKGEWCLCFLLL